MHSLEREIFHIWRPDLYGIVGKAIAQRSRVSIQSHMPLDKCNTADVTLEGRFLGTMGHQTQYIVESFDLHTCKNHPIFPECDYTFMVNMPFSGDAPATIEYGGRGVILDQELRKNNLPEFLLLRIAQPTRIRRARRHERVECADGLVQMPGLMIIDQEPVNRRKLLALLGHYYQQKNRSRPKMVNISAGGACLESADPLCQRFMSADENYLFFFFPENGKKPKCPCVFVCKKAGIFRGDDARHAGLRIKFARELVWTSPEEELKWMDVEAEGSESIKKLLDSAKNKETSKKK